MVIDREIIQMYSSTFPQNCTTATMTVHQGVLIYDGADTRLYMFSKSLNTLLFVSKGF